MVYFLKKNIILIKVKSFNLLLSIQEVENLIHDRYNDKRHPSHFFNECEQLSQEDKPASTSKLSLPVHKGIKQKNSIKRNK